MDRFDMVAQSSDIFSNERAFRTFELRHFLTFVFHMPGQTGFGFVGSRAVHAFESFAGVLIRRFRGEHFVDFFVR